MTVKIMQTQTDEPASKKTKLENNDVDAGDGDGEEEAIDICSTEKKVGYETVGDVIVPCIFRKLVPVSTAGTQSAEHSPKRKANASPVTTSSIQQGGTTNSSASPAMAPNTTAPSHTSQVTSTTSAVPTTAVKLTTSSASAPSSPRCHASPTSRRPSSASAPTSPQCKTKGLIDDTSAKVECTTCEPGNKADDSSRVQLQKASDNELCKCASDNEEKPNEKLINTECNLDPDKKGTDNGREENIGQAESKEAKRDEVGGDCSDAESDSSGSITITAALVKYTATRIVQDKLLSRYSMDDIKTARDSCVVCAIPMTQTEAAWLTEINHEHCGDKFGVEPFLTGDRIVPIPQVRQFLECLRATAKPSECDVAVPAVGVDTRPAAAAPVNQTAAPTEAGVTSIEASQVVVDEPPTALQQLTQYHLQHGQMQQQRMQALQRSAPHPQAPPAQNTPAAAEQQRLALLYQQQQFQQEQQQRLKRERLELQRRMDERERQKQQQQQAAAAYQRQQQIEQQQKQVRLQVLLQQKHRGQAAAAAQQQVRHHQMGAPPPPAIAGASGRHQQQMYAGGGAGVRVNGQQHPANTSPGVPSRVRGGRVPGTPPRTHIYPATPATSTATPGSGPGYSGGQMAPPPPRPPRPTTGSGSQSNLLPSKPILRLVQVSGVSVPAFCLKQSGSNQEYYAIPAEQCIMDVFDIDMNYISDKRAIEYAVNAAAIPSIQMGADYQRCLHEYHGLTMDSPGSSSTSAFTGLLIPLDHIMRNNHLKQKLTDALRNYYKYCRN